MIGIFRRGDEEAPNKLAVGICTLGVMRIETLVMLMSTGMPLGQAQAFIIVVGKNVQDARNTAWNVAEGQGWEYFMFWDDDVVPLKFGAVETLVETMDQNPEIDILGGVYPARQGIPSPIVLKERNGNPWWGWEDGGIHKVWMTGTGFTIYRMSSVKKLKTPTKRLQTTKGPWDIREYFRLQDGTDDYVLAEDAAKAGLSWYVHGGIVADQIETTGQRFEIKNARQRIGGKNGNSESTDTQGSDDSGPAGVRAGNGRPADVRIRRPGGGRTRSGAGAGGKR